MAEKKKKRIIVTLNCGKVSIGEPKKQKSRRSKAHPRTNRTYQNKISKLKSKYRRLYRNSLKAKEKNPDAKKERFCDKFPDVKAYLSQYKLKEVGKIKENSVSISERKKELKEKVVRGGLLGNY